ncbi:hypothetical protein [Pedobacter sp. UBA5917]|uniref:hypothetical protein n=1 Tax=Pedobacter sp. UBA5917 TaxID=1947061 RepID=UPI0025DB816E|nr:hypothetical protein [Pedobacter sp. UBA5917]
MKVVAMFMVICMCLVSVSYRSVQAMQYGKPSICCIHAGRTGPCKSHKSDKAAAMCLTRLCCNVVGFTTNTPVNIGAIAPIDLKSSAVNPGHESPIDFSYPFWQPPKVVL